VVQMLMVHPAAVKPAAFFSLRFSKRIQILQSDSADINNQIGNYLMEGYQAYLPDEFLSGGKNTAKLVHDYVNEKLLYETQGDFG